MNKGNLVACWCNNPDFLVLQGSYATGLGQSPPRLWCILYLMGLDLAHVNRVTEEIDLVLPCDTWYYGCREDHVHASLGGHDLLHASLLLLVGSRVALPPQEIVTAVCSLLPQHSYQMMAFACPDHLTTKMGVRFHPVAEWVQALVGRIDVARKRACTDGLHRSVFGFDGVLALLRIQFGTAVAWPVQGMLLAKQVTDEEDGLLSGGFALERCCKYLSDDTVYVVDDDTS
ncbi:hypothetical protein EDB80DRAFT_733196 [Ilyonectria destructans]|nr:hypothetical protein EDB80DRAFT_733196 [Ilyonectria destructans]